MLILAGTNTPHTNLIQRLLSAIGCCGNYPGLLHVANERSEDFESLPTQGLIQGNEQKTLSEMKKKHPRTVSLDKVFLKTGYHRTLIIDYNVFRT